MEEAAGLYVIWIRVGLMRGDYEGENSGFPEHGAAGTA